MTTESMQVLEVAREAARRAAGLCQAVLQESAQRPDSMSKDAREPVTVADYGSQAVILDAVRQHFPTHNVISEEGSAHLQENAGDEGTAQITRLVTETLGRPTSFEDLCGMIDHEGPDNAEFTWAIDPIDGTKGFLRRAHYAVAIGILRNGKPWAGALACPFLPVERGDESGERGVLFLAGEGYAATSEPISGGEAAPTLVSAHTDPANVRVMGSVESSHGDPKLLKALIAEMKLTSDIVRIDSQVKYGAVARGEAEIYLRPRSRPDWRENIWDHAAGVILAQEAGGRVSDLDGRDLDFSIGKKLDENRGVLATNGIIHDQVLDSLRRIEAHS